MLEQWMNWFLNHTMAQQVVVVGGLLAFAAIADFVTRKGLLRLLNVAVSKSKTNWDDAVVQRHVFNRLAHLAPAIVIYFGINFAGIHPTVTDLVQRVTGAAMIIVVLRTLRAFLDAVNDIYSEFPEAKVRPIKGYLQVIALIAYLLGGVVIIATLLDRSPMVFLTGIGALSAVLLLVFKDTLLSLVASIQLTSNDMVRVGDWIEVPNHNADGDVVDIALHTIKVQNWDKTTTTIPTYALITHGFKNWRSMGEAGGRRIRRSFFIDANSITYLTDDQINSFSKYEVLKDYIAQKIDEIESSNQEKTLDDDAIPDIRRLTNIGTLRAYILLYLQARSDIRDDMTLMVRQMDPTPKGLPIQIYCFTTTTDWGDYEGIQSDIFDHLLALIPQFGLRVFQEPTGSDFRDALTS